MAAHFSSTPERKVVYAWEGEVAGLRAEIERLRAALGSAKVAIMNQGKDALSRAAMKDIDAALNHKD